MDPDFARQYYESAAVDHWWFQGRRLLVGELLTRRGVGSGSFLDLGAGADSMLPEALSIIKLDIVCPQPKPDIFVQASAEALPFPTDAFDGLGAFDVLEHLGDTRQCLTEVRRVVRPGGLVVVTVPAHRWLWSGHDRVVGHHRRYTVRSLSRDLGGAGLRIDWISAFYGFLVPAGLVRSLLALKSSMSLPPASLNRILTRIACRSARAALGRPSRVGLSIAAVASVP